MVAHPDDESFGLGGVIDAFVRSGTEVSVLCFTRGEASTLHGVEGDLATVRAEELAAAGRELGVRRVELRSYADGALRDVPLDLLVEEVRALAADVGAEGVLVFDVGGVTSHPDHDRATEAAVVAATDAGLGVLAWTLPQTVADTLTVEHGFAFIGRDDADVDVVVPVRRDRQVAAVHCHPSQAVPGSVLWRRLDLLGRYEHLRWLTPARASAAAAVRPGSTR
ncbi:MAG: PIG-L deacetylase family protein [Candidatus Nanopelagicales bacterium]